MLWSNAHAYYGIQHMRTESDIDSIVCRKHVWPAGACAWPGGHALYHVPQIISAHAMYMPPS